jgi:hypothetical protein
MDYPIQDIDKISKRIVKPGYIRRCSRNFSLFSSPCNGIFTGHSERGFLEPGDNCEFAGLIFQSARFNFWALRHLKRVMNTQTIIPPAQQPEFSFSPWAWFGAQVGSTIWLLHALWTLGFHASPELFCTVLVCFAVPNLVGLALWFRRRRVGVWTAVRSLLVAITICDLRAMISLHNRPEFARELSPETFVAFGVTAAVLFIIIHRRALRS